MLYLIISQKGVRFENIFRIIILLVCGQSNMLKITCQQIIIVLVIELLLSLQHYCDLHPNIHTPDKIRHGIVELNAFCMHENLAK